MSRNPWGIALCFVALCCLLAEPPAALGATVDINFGSSPNPVGSGARALGLASAFIATADDATAASWNPGGLIALERSEMSLVLDAKLRREFYDGPLVDDGDAVQGARYGGINYFSVAVPFKIRGRFFVAALNFQSLIDFHKDSRMKVLYAEDTTEFMQHIDLRQRGRLHSITPALAFQISPRVAVGIALNLWTDDLGYDNGWTEWRHLRTIGEGLVVDVVRNDRFTFDGVGANLGILWDITQRWTLGAVFKTPTWGTAHRQADQTTATYASDGTVLSAPQALAPLRVDEPMSWPPSYGIGLAYRHSDAFTLSADVYRTEWGLFRRRKTEYDRSGHRAINPISGERFRDARVAATTQAHLGGEYLLVFSRTVVPLRGGVFYDPEPQTAGTNHFFGFAAGTGLSWNDTIFDIAYQMRNGPSADPSIVHIPAEHTGTYLLNQSGATVQHSVYLSAIQHF